LANGTVVQLSPLLYLVVANLDGRRHLGEVASAVSAAAGRTVSADNIEFLVSKKLRPLGIVATEQPGRLATTPSPPLLGLHLRIGVVPEHVVRVAARRLRALFLPPLVVAVICTVVAFDAWALANHGLAAASVEMIHQPLSIIFLAALMVAAAGFHELGHAAACLYGGARPGKIGIGLYLMWPVFYNDVTDSYRLNRAGRLRTDLGGVYFNAIAILVTAGAYLVTGFEPLLVFVAVQHLVVLQQFLPFVRLDGYYVVSDLIGVPDLYRRLGPMVRSVLPWREVAPEVSELRPGPRFAVALWACITVPALGAALAWLLTRGPKLVQTSLTSAALQVDILTGALERGEIVTAALAAVQVLSLMAPVVGISLVAVRCLLRCERAGRARLRSRTRQLGRRLLPPPSTTSARVGAADCVPEQAPLDSPTTPALWLPAPPGPQGSADRAKGRLSLPFLASADGPWPSCPLSQPTWWTMDWPPSCRQNLTQADTVTSCIDNLQRFCPSSDRDVAPWLGSLTPFGITPGPHLRGIRPSYPSEPGTVLLVTIVPRIEYGACWSALIAERRHGKLPASAEVLWSIAAGGWPGCLSPAWLGGILTFTGSKIPLHDEHHKMEMAGAAIVVLVGTIPAEQDSVAGVRMLNLTLDAQGQRPFNHEQQFSGSELVGFGDVAVANRDVPVPKLHMVWGVGTYHQRGGTSFHAPPQRHCIWRLDQTNCRDLSHFHESSNGKRLSQVLWK
jgi:putative peptide zinc metalloprotease protein